MAGTGGRVRYDKGDAEIAVTWLQRDVSGGDERRTFKVWAADNTETGDDGPVEGETYSFNSTELRLIHNPEAGPGAVQLDMKLLPPVGNIPLGGAAYGPADIITPCTGAACSLPCEITAR